MNNEEFQRTVLKGVEALTERSTQQGETIATLEKQVEDIVSDLRQARKMLVDGTGHGVKNGEVGDGTARFLGALAIVAGIKQGALSKDKYLGIAEELGGVEMKSALTSSEIPLPTVYSADIIALVSMYGAARKHGTVFPVSGATQKLPALSTDPTFGLIAASAAVTEKSPAFGWVNFTPEKFGGLIRFPAEIEEDSVVALGQFLARYAARNLARAEDYNYFSSTGAGSGVNGSVKGLLYSTIDNAKVVQMASTKTHYSDATLVNIRAIRGVVDTPALSVGAYYMHPSFEQHLAGLNTSGDKPYTANGLQGAALDGFPIRFVDIMPAYSAGVNAGKVFMLFGDLSYQYLGVRGQVRIDSSREAGFTTDEVLFRALERFTIGLMAVGAIAGLETAAS